jgi:hypothetical protein
MQRLFCCLTVLLWTLAEPQFLPGTNLELNPNLLPNHGRRESSLRLDIQPLPGGAELLTLFAHPGKNDEPGEFPLMSILRDSLGRPESEVHRFRQVWLYPQSQPSVGQRVASAIPFFYFGSSREAGFQEKAPAPLLDLAKPMPSLWRRVLMSGVQRTLFDSQAFYIRSSTRTVQHNLGSHRSGQLVRVSSILSLYESGDSPEGASSLSPQAWQRLKAKVMLAEKSSGALVRDVDLDRAYTSKTQQLEEMRGRNWELLRQRAETEGLYFDPLGVDSTRATHALVWVARPDLRANQGRSYDGRFLNIASPWNDERLLNWDKYSEVWHLDEQHRRVGPDHPEARPVEMIPLAIYGLENPRIPALLVDYRNTGNPKRRELSRRILDDTTRNVLGISPFGNVPYFLGRSALAFALDRWGKDVNQPSRLRSLSQLELALTLDSAVSSQLREHTGRKFASVSVNPLDNVAGRSAELARWQYQQLLASLQQPEKAEQVLGGQREAEARSLLHSRGDRTLLAMARVITFGLYRHREKLSAELEEKLAQQRRIDHHLQILRRATRQSTQTEVVWDLENLRHSLEVLSEANSPMDKKITSAVGRLLNRTQSEELRLLCLKSLQRIRSPRPTTYDLYQAASSGDSPNPPGNVESSGFMGPFFSKAVRKENVRDTGF